MASPTRHMLTAFAAAIFLCAAVGSASANRLSISNRNIRVVWTPLEFEAGGETIRCNVTLEGSFHFNTIIKTPQALIGHITRAIVDARSCVGAFVTVLTATLPWHLSYEGFRTLLPAIASIDLLLLNLSLVWDPDGLPACLIRTTTENPARFIANREAGGNLTGLTANEEAEIPLTGGFLCNFGSGHFIGSAPISLLGTINPVRVTLI